MKFFTPKEANQTLPLVKKIVGDILKAGQAIRELSMERAKPEEDPEIIRLMDHLDELFEELETIGCSYKDWNFSDGLVDFPSVLNGKEVCLCWRSDEASVEYFHGAEEGFTGRKAIPKEWA
ncbi:MAG: DUF2203 domain-containing protein [Candidatus Omnitrophica bacterium]|nr:DUF2203 domain-containing protein [Candidatus Omnitrophota bacterium]